MSTSQRRRASGHLHLERIAEIEREIGGCQVAAVG